MHRAFSISTNRVLEEAPRLHMVRTDISDFYIAKAKRSLVEKLNRFQLFGALFAVSLN